MRDGAEIDLDLDVTQRMIEDDTEYVNKLDQVIPAFTQANNLLTADNEFLELERI